jgi:hypothetical protein
MDEIVLPLNVPGVIVEDHHFPLITWFSPAARLPRAALLDDRLRRSASIG